MKMNVDMVGLSAMNVTISMVDLNVFVEMATTTPLLLQLVMVRTLYHFNNLQYTILILLLYLCRCQRVCL